MAKFDKTMACIMTALLLLSGCRMEGDRNVSCSDSMEDRQGEGKLETLDLSTDTDLEKSQFQDFPDKISAKEPKCIGNDYYIYDLVYNDLSKTSYQLDDTILTLKIMNKTNVDIYSDSTFQLEIRLENEWFIIPPVNYNFTDISDIYPPGGEYIYMLDLSEIDVNFIPGEYRILKIYSMENFDGTIVSINNFSFYR